MFDFYITCKRCGHEDLHGWHPLWDWGKKRELCVSCRDTMYERHKVWMDKLHQRFKYKHDLEEMGYVDKKGG